MIKTSIFVGFFSCNTIFDWHLILLNVFYHIGMCLLIVNFYVIVQILSLQEYVYRIVDIDNRHRNIHKNRNET